jgi:hypothetical protein
VATYTPNGVNGVNQQLTQLPEDIGQLANLKQLYLEWNNLTSLPSSFSQLSNLENLAISNNWLIALPNDFGNLTELSFLDLGYNQIAEIPESIGNLLNIEYLWLFNNQLSSVPETICDLPLTWSGTDYNNYPYFAIGGNQLCEDVPECVANSEHFNISLDQFYYSFMIADSQDCEVTGIVENVHYPTSFKLYNPYPNPFNPSTTIRFSVVTTDLLSLLVFDITGWLVETLIDGKMEPGTHEIMWDAQSYPAGIYFVQMTSGRYRQVRKLILIK